MQLISLYIKKYNHLEDFTIEFKQNLSVIIGVNGSGKSSILEVLAIIFSDAYLNNEASLGFKLIYTLGTSTVELSAEGVGLGIKMNGKSKIDKSLLPSNVVVYYSGLSDKMAKLCEIHENKQKDDFKNGRATKRPFFYYRPENFKMFLLSLFSFEFGSTKDFLLEKVNLTNLENFSIEINKPIWKNIKTNSSDFWGLDGVSRQFCDKLNEYCDYQTLDKYTDNSIKYFFNSTEGLYEIENYIGGKQIFESLDMLSYQGMLGEITLSLNKKGQIMDSDALSEGEKQVIAIRGINDLLIEENTLLLFDEPDTYLHPSWQREFLGNIEQLTQSQNAHLVVTSHSPMMIANMKKGDLFKMQNGEAKYIEGGYYGKDYAFTLETQMDTSSRNAETQGELNQLFEWIETDKLQEAQILLGELEKKYPSEPELIRAQTMITLLTDED